MTNKIKIAGGIMADESKRYFEEINVLIGESIVHLLKKENLLHDRDLRNIKIRSDFNRMLAKNIPAGEAIRSLSEKIYYLEDGQQYKIAERSIEKIIYPNKKK